MVRRSYKLWEFKYVIDPVVPCCYLLLEICYVIYERPKGVGGAVISFTSHCQGISETLHDKHPLT